MSTYVDDDDPVIATKPGDENFKFSTKFIQYPRAAIGVDAKCPNEYKDLIQKMQHHGWIYPIAYIPSREFIWGKLKE